MTFPTLIRFILEHSCNPSRDRWIFWKTLLVVGALSASGHCAPSQKVLTYAEAVEQGVVNYNKKAKEDSLYRLLEAVPRPGWVGTLHFRSIVDFTLRRETVCPAKEEASLDKCDFKEGGVSDGCGTIGQVGETPPHLRPPFVTCFGEETPGENGISQAFPLNRYPTHC
uniref:Vipericidin n=1 Tax=Naja naja TaxID=35670 RepID=A0A8C6XTN1_NAJNA